MHGCDIRYFNNVCDSPKVNSKQISELLKYIRLQLNCIGVNYIWINGKIVQYSKIKQMDEIAFNKLFEIWIFSQNVSIFLNEKAMGLAYLEEEFNLKWDYILNNL